MPTGISANAHAGTPTLQVSDARGLMVRTVQFHRRDADDLIDTRVTEQRYDAVGRLLASRDPYLFDLARTDEATPFNLVQVTSLSGAVMSTDSVDAGWRVALTGASGQGLENWDGRGSHFRTEFDALLRPVAIHERRHEIPEHTLERFTYAEASAEAAARNLCGQICRHDDPAGTVHVHDLGLSGNVLSHTRHFLLDITEADWPLEIAKRDELLEPGTGATTLYAYAANGEPLSQTDALGNRQDFAYTIDGQLKNTRLTLAGDGQAEKVLVSDLHYNASGQIESETAGNGVITRHHYDPANAQLTGLSAHKADGTALQQLKYQYDPIGNVLSIEDAAQPIRYFNNQRIEPIKTYRYDTLDQLIEATGSEAKTGHGGPALPDFQPLVPDPDQIANYTQTFHYDAGGNLLKLVHVGAQAQGRTLTRARYSNRCLLNSANRRITEKVMNEDFDANGNLCALQAGQRLIWDLRNQLREVRPVVREESEDDRECYLYDGKGQRVRKVRTWLTNARSITSEVRYPPGVEIRTHGGTGEILHVITASAGSNSVQVLHWDSTPPDGMAQDHVRYNISDHLKSSTLELDQQADVISHEGYYAFAGTARWAGRNAIEAKYKTVRYSGKERDATGLYYYGFRYYAPWLQRWINPDPAGDLDGLNRYRMLSNKPLAYFDPDGLGITSAEELTRIEKFKVNIDNQISFYMPDRVERIYSSAGRKERMQFIEENLDHEPIGAHGIYTSGRSENTDEFLNDFYRDMWIFKANRRDPKNKNYFATDIYLYQFKLKLKQEQEQELKLKSRQKNDISGHLPSVIKRENVQNGVTLKKTEKLKSGSDKMLTVFLNETPNGKSTQRLLNEIGMKATAVERFEDGDSSYPDFLVHVVPDLSHTIDISSQPAMSPLTAIPLPQTARARPRSLLSRIFQPNRSSTKAAERDQVR